MSTETRDAVSNVETEFLEINSKGAWAILYQHIRNESSNYDYSCNESKKLQNKNLNRYRDVAPYDHTRVILKRGSCDYINANLVKMEKAHRQYILTQGPLPCTAGHFWLMVWEQNSKAILMLNKVIEKEQVKCHQYWPLGGSNSTMTFSDVNLKVDFVKKIETSHYTTSTLRLTDLETKQSREILHFHYITWPDFGVPQSPVAFLRFLVDVRKSGALDSNVGPPIVHCSAGIGRSGTFCLVDTCLVLIEENGLNSVNVKEVLLEMRRSRMGLIQTPDQLRFSYAAIIEGAKQLPSNNNLDDGIEIINHYDVVNNDIMNSSQEEDDEPPPLPPPRGDSLTRSMMSDLTPSPVSENENGTGPPNKPLPMEPPILIDNINKLPTTNSNNVHENNVDAVEEEDSENALLRDSSPRSDTSDTKNELRQRHQEKKDRLAKQVREMKRRQQQTENWQKFKRSIFKPVTLGIDQKAKQRNQFKCTRKLTLLDDSNKRRINNFLRKLNKLIIKSNKNT
ncbi:tyrosine-protein phosphatase non-receptor type 1 isoform X1 [Microplitis demolitor]|uniref:tyrosine-protein phosphatase non-receptor type 1 isoform X1 n=1 Tax=Microplitis demolitor TaxID=69319 RepID=UPI0004CD6943|nr:tyrosine-protein phosphatase non-receptor type 1 isoform X1 [Microplitis demolitor]